MNNDLSTHSFYRYHDNLFKHIATTFQCLQRNPVWLQGKNGII